LLRFPADRILSATDPGGEGMSDQKPDGGYSRSNWPKYLLIYLLVGGAIYAVVYFLFFADGYGS
jgi:hypothetical protein